MPPKRQKSPSPSKRTKSPSPQRKKLRPPMSLKPFIRKSPSSAKPVYAIPTSPTQFPAFYYAPPPPSRASPTARSPRQTNGNGNGAGGVSSAVFSIPSSTGGSVRYSSPKSPAAARSPRRRRRSPSSPTF